MRAGASLVARPAEMIAFGARHVPGSCPGEGGRSPRFDGAAISSSARLPLAPVVPITR